MINVNLLTTEKVIRTIVEAFNYKEANEIVMNKTFYDSEFSDLDMFIRNKLLDLIDMINSDKNTNKFAIELAEENLDQKIN